MNLFEGWDFSPGQLVTPGEVARMSRVHPKTVTRWTRAGKLAAIRTPGGHRRYSREQVDALMRGVKTPPQRRNAKVTS